MSVEVVSVRLRERRKKSGLSQGQVAEYEQISQGHISDLETGRSVPQVLGVIAQLAQRYRTSTDYLLGLTDDPRPLASEQALHEEGEQYITTKWLTDEERALLNFFNSLDEEERVFVFELLEFVKRRTTPRIIE